MTPDESLEESGKIPARRGLIPVPQSKLGVSQVDLAFYVSEYDEDIRLNLMYSTELFKRETMNDFIDFFQEILFTATNNMEVKLEDFKMKHDFVSAGTAGISDEDSDFGF